MTIQQMKTVDLDVIIDLASRYRRIKDPLVLMIDAIAWGRSARTTGNEPVV
jgi:hypothetical protein